MPKTLVIVESPSKAKTINKYLGNDYIVEASVGHIVDLPKSKIGIDIDNDFKPQYINMRDKRDVIKKLKSTASEVESVLIATDPDREGEAIAWHIKNVLEEENTNIQRIEFNEITRSAVEEALTHPRDIDLKRVDSQQARRVLDRIVGYKVSPFLWKSIYRGLSAGRVQSVSLRLICEREKEIKAFVPEEYWTIKSIFSKDKDQIEAKLEKINNKKASITNEADATEHVKQIKASSFSISKKETKRISRQPAPPFVTSTLQQEAVRKLRMTPKRVMSTAQSLYEGVNIGKFGQVGLITYMRTDSVRISNESLDQVRDFILNTYGDDNLPDKPRFYKTKKSAQDAHEAIRPTYINKDYDPETLKSYLNKDQLRLYTLIWNRFVACQMSPAKFDKTNIEISDSTYMFKVTGEVLVFKGYLNVYDNRQQQEDEEAELPIPAGLNQGDDLIVKEVNPKQNFTKPPARYTESTIIKELDELGIGRPSTYAQILSTILDRKYVESIERKLHSTELGMTVNEILTTYFPDLINVKFTANMESRLDEIENNKENYVSVLKDFYTPFEKSLDNANGKTKEIKNSIQKETDIKCENDDLPMIIRWGKNGKFLACSGYPKCTNTKQLDEEGNVVENTVEYSEHTHDCKEGARYIVKTGRYGKYLSCENCGHNKPIPSGITCPKCKEGDVINRRSKRGRIFYGCTNYPKCDFVSWDPVVNEACTNCDSKYLLKKSTKKKGDYKVCPECKTEYTSEAVTE